MALYEHDGVELHAIAVQCLCAELRDYAADAARLEREIVALRPAVVAQKPRIALSQITDVVCARFKVSADEIMAKHGRQHVCDARNILFWLAGELTSLSRSQIGRKIGGRDHSSVCAGIARADGLRRNPDWLRRSDNLRTALLAEARVRAVNMIELAA